MMEGQIITQLGSNTTQNILQQLECISYLMVFTWRIIKRQVSIGLLREQHFRESGAAAAAVPVAVGIHSR